MTRNMRITNNEEGKLLGNFPCPLCREIGKDRKGDNLSVYEKTNSTDGWCWSCEKRFTEDELDDLNINTTISTSGFEKLKENTAYGQNIPDMATLMAKKATALKERHLSSEIAALYGVKQIEGRRYYPRHNKGRLTGFKCRVLPKEFDPAKGAVPVGETAMSEFWGQQLYKNGGKILIITEGEEDAMAACQMTAKHSPTKVGYPSVSLPNGISSLKKCLVENFDFLNKFEKVIFMLDQEPEVFEKLDKLVQLLPPKLAYIGRFSEKDASDMLINSKDYEFYKAVFNAEQWKPEGIISGSDTWTMFKESKHRVVGLPFPEKFGLKDKYLGMVKGNLDVIGAFEKAGKSTMIKEIVHDLRIRHNKKVGLFMLEEFIEETVGDLLSVDLQRNLGVYGSEVSEKSKEQSWEKLFGDNNIVLSDAHSFMSIDDLIYKIRFMNLNFGIEYFFIDNLTKLVRLLVQEQSNENFLTSRIMVELERLCKDLGVYICLVCHVRKETGDGKSYSEGKILRVHDLYGSGDISKFAYNVFAISRDNTFEPNITQYHLITTRRGRLGFGNRLTYNFDKCILEEYREDNGEVM